MKTLFEAMRDFNARNASENTIQEMFAEIAVPALSGGYFLANNTKIYPVDIEFYLYGERKGDAPWMKDKNMYHKGPNVPYFLVIAILFLDQHFPVAAVGRTNVF